MSESWRCFVAVPIGEVLRRDLAAAVESWRGRPDLEGLRWTDPDGWHVTMAFLGSIDAATVDAITAAIETVAAAHGPMRLRTGRFGGFPSAGRARVAWYGSADAARDLRALATDLRRALGLDTAAPFQAHVTLARARREPVDLRGWLAEASAPKGQLVDRLELMRSHVGRGPARYERLSSAELGVGAHV